jgi:hypothetical protein
MVIAIGGGSVLDSAKVINLMMVKGGPLQQHMGAQLLKDRLLAFGIYSHHFRYRFRGDSVCDGIRRCQLGEIALCGRPLSFLILQSSILK